MNREFSNLDWLEYTHSKGASLVLAIFCCDGGESTDVPFFAGLSARRCVIEFDNYKVVSY
jgi:hypothetical protein